MRPRPIQKAFLVLLTFAGSMYIGAFASTTNSRNQNYRVLRWTTEQGLPQNRISSLEQTRDGYLWIGTWWGLARFDGVRFVVFDKYNTPELVNDAINVLAEDSEGTLWIGTADGLVSYRDHRFRRALLPAGLDNQKIWRLAASFGGGVWVDTDSGLLRIRHNQFSKLWPLDSESTGRVLSLQEGSNGWLEIVLQRAWLSLAPETDQWKTNYLESPVNPFWSSGLLDRDSDRLRVCTPKGVAEVVRGATNVSFRQPELGWPDATYLFHDRAGGLWINAEGTGLFRWDGKTLNPVSLEESFPASSVHCMKEDLEGNLWAGTELGLVQLQPRRVRTYTKADGLTDDNVWSVCEGNEGTVWVGTDRGLSRIVNNRAEHLTHREDAHIGYRGVWPASRGGVWVGANHGAQHFYEGTFEPYMKGDLLPDSLPIPCGGTLYEDRSGRFWVGNGNGAYFVNEGLLTKLSNEIAGPNPFEVRAIHEDRQGSFWFGTYGQGLVQWRDGNFKVFTTRDGLSNDRVWGIHEDGEGALWLATENGLTRFKQQRGVPITSRHGLRENVVNWILEDNFGYFWLSGLRGIYRVSRAELNAVGDGRARELDCAAFTTADGMASSETNGERAPAGWKARDGRLWFPTTRGVVVIDPQAIHMNEVAPPVVIEQVIDQLADGNPVIYGDGAATEDPSSESRNTRKGLSPGRARVLEFHYTASSFAAPERVRFKYRLQGYDQDWRRDDANRRAAYYTNLRPGNYQFEVLACNNHGVWSEQPAVFAFSLAPHFWQTWPFYAATGTLVVLSGFAMHHQRVRGLRRIQRLERQRAVEQERSRIARDLHDDLGASLTGVALQLEAAQRQGRAEGPQLAALAGETRSLAHELRELAWTTNPRCDNAGSLVAFISEQTERFCQAAGLECRLSLPDTERSCAVPARVRHELLVILKESFANVAVHAGARRVKVSLAIHGEEARLVIEDDGRGFDPTRPAAGSGLRNLRERVEKLGGSFVVGSQPGGGTSIAARLPTHTANTG